MMTKTNETEVTTGTKIVMPHEGGPEVLTVAPRELRILEPGQVMVRVEAAGVSFAEVQMLKGRYFGQPKFPFVPGYDLVGTVEKVGEGVGDELLGRRMAALTQTGAWADRVALDAKDLAPVPNGLDPADAVAAITNGVTAWQMIHRVAKVRPGHTMLVHGASGGVGTLLVQLARLAGAEVIGTASAPKHGIVRDLGATPVDYKPAGQPRRRSLVERGYPEYVAPGRARGRVRAIFYAARFESEHVIYCEHGNQFDTANTITDYDDPLDTPLGDHVVTDVVRRVVTGGRITKSFDLRDVNKVFPLATIPEWIAGRVFYDLLGRVATRLLLPLLVGYAAYGIVAHLLAVARDGSPSSFWESYRTLPGVQVLFGEIAWDAALLVLFLLAIRRTAARLGSSFALPFGERAGQMQDPARSGDSPGGIRNLLASEHYPPMVRGLRGREIAVFVSGHTHAPSLSPLPREAGSGAILVNSGCWLRQLRPVPARFGGPPVFVPKFVLTHARVYLGDDGVHVELWEHPKPAPQRLRLIERLVILGRLPPQPAAGTKPRISARETLGSSR